MKFYTRDPDAAIGGMAELNFEQVGFYNLVLDLLYARDGIVPGDDASLAQILRRDPRAVRRLKNELMALGKIRLTTDGLLTANRVEATRLRAEIRSISARYSANVRWKNYRNAKENNGTPMRVRNAPIPIPNNSEIPSKGEDSETDAVDEGDNFGLPERHSTAATGELAAIIRAKGWK